MKDRFLVFTEGVSRGRETEGYTIITLTDSETGKKYRTMGGGYDMTGTVLADWMSDVLQAELLEMLKAEGFQTDEYASGGAEARAQGKTYGCLITREGLAAMDGAVGSSSVEAVIKRLGYNIKSVYTPKRGNKWGKFQGYQVSQKEGA